MSKVLAGWSQYNSSFEMAVDEIEVEIVEFEKDLDDSYNLELDGHGKVRIQI